MINEDFSMRSRLQDVGRWYITRFVRQVAKELPPGCRVLDAGAGEGVYKKFFTHCNYKSIDLAVGESRWNYSSLDYVAPLHDMPIDSNSFDAVLCTQVLEHLEWPRESLAEMCRVLKPGGILYMTVPMAHPEHQIPHDYFRYTSYGLTFLCKQAGFREIRIQPFGGMWVRWAYELPRGLALFPGAGIRAGKPQLAGIMLLPVRWAYRIMLPLLQRLFLWLDRYDQEKDDPFGWSCVAIK